MCKVKNYINGPKYIHGETRGNKGEDPWSVREDRKHEKEEHGGGRKRPKEKR